MITSFRDAVARLAALRRQQRIPQLDFVVAALPRSGTRFTSHLLTELGCECGHESMFLVPRPTLTVALHSLFNRKLGRLTSDASWLVAPHLGQLPARTKILHQVRNPVHVIRSLTGIGFFTRAPEDRLYGYTEVAHEQLPSLPSDPLQMCMAFWTLWNRLIQTESADHDYIRYRLEDLTNRREETLTGIASRIPDCSVEQLAAKLESFPTDVNRRQRDNSVTWDKLPEGNVKTDLLDLANAYGYDLEALKQA